MTNGLGKEPPTLFQSGMSSVKSGMASVKLVAVSVGRRVRRRPHLFILVGLGVVIVGGAITAAIAGMPDWEVLDDVRETVLAKPTLAELRKKAKSDPKNSALQVELGHAHFEAGNRAAAVRAYARALSLDPQSATGRMIDNLVACFRTREQSAAAALIGRHKLTDAESKLDDLTRDKRASVRWGAIRTLEKLGKASRVDYVNVYLIDLESAECNVRRNAVGKLGELGDKRTISHLRAAGKKDEKDTPWYAASCLGSRVEDAEKRILARK